MEGISADCDMQQRRVTRACDSCARKRRKCECVTTFIRCCPRSSAEGDFYTALSSLCVGNVLQQERIKSARIQSKFPQLCSSLPLARKADICFRPLTLRAVFLYRLYSVHWQPGLAKWSSSETALISGLSLQTCQAKRSSGRILQAR